MQRNARKGSEKEDKKHGGVTHYIDMDMEKKFTSAESKI